MSARAFTPTGELPEALTERAQWLCWRYRENGAAKPAKLPCTPAGGPLPGWQSDPAKWMSFDDAVAAFEQNPALAGVGFVLTASSGIIGFDLDGAINEEGEVLPWAKAHLNDLRGTYVEYSPSGRGFRAFARGNLPEDAPRHVGQREIYDRGRWLTVTGRMLAGNEVIARPQAVEAYLHAMRAERGTQAPAPAGGGLPEGQRNAGLTALAGFMRRGGLREPEIEAALQAANIGRCARPLASDEVSRIARSIARYAPAQDVVQDAGQHPLTRFVDVSLTPKPPRWLLPGFFAEGLTLIGGQHGVGKTTALLPLACGVAGLHEPGWLLAPKHWRNVVYITEDPAQALRILHGLARHLNIEVAAICARVHLVEACRLPADELVQVGEHYRERFARTAEGVELAPLVVLDTQAAALALESENDNSEASAAIAALKQRFAGLSVWLVAHISKANLNRRDVQNLTARGASAWEADAHTTAVLIREGEDADATRWLVLGKRRFEPRWPELQLESYWQNVTALDAWGAAEALTLRWAIARPPQASRRDLAAELKAQREQEADADLRDGIRAAVQMAWAQGNPLNRAGVRAQVRRKAAEVVACIERLLHEGWLLEIHVPAKLRAHPSRADFLVNLDTSERDAICAGEPAPSEKLAIPASWKRGNPPVPGKTGQATENSAEVANA